MSSIMISGFVKNKGYVIPPTYSCRTMESMPLLTLRYQTQKSSNGSGNMCTCFSRIVGPCDSGVASRKFSIMLPHLCFHVNHVYFQLSPVLLHLQCRQDGEQPVDPPLIRQLVEVYYHRHDGQLKCEIPDMSMQSLFRQHLT